jgi:hypothetical protein
MKKKLTLLPRKEWASYQLALRIMNFMESKGWRAPRKGGPIVKDVAAEIRAYRSEERKVN